MLSYYMQIHILSDAFMRLKKKKILEIARSMLQKRKHEGLEIRGQGTQWQKSSLFSWRYEINELDDRSITAP